MPFRLGTKRNQGDSARAGEPPVLVCETTTEGEESMKGIITEIERFALKDGPGIRTTVFFKGCNMACKWCHNPETLSVRPQLMIYPDKCIGCGACVEACRAGARTLGKKRCPAVRSHRLQALRSLRRELLLRCSRHVRKGDDR